MKVFIDDYVADKKELLTRLECQKCFFKSKEKEIFANPSALRPFVLKVEGGLSGATSDLASSNYCPTPLDGRFYHTNQGITYTTWVHYMGKDRDLAFLKLDQRDWMYIFVNGYWNRAKASEIKSQKVANSIVDWIWGSGVWGIRYSQRVLGVKDDGIVGKITLGAINSYNPDKLEKLLNDRREKHFRDISKNIAGQNVNLRGWLNRLNMLREFNEQF